MAHILLLLKWEDIHMPEEQKTEETVKQGPEIRKGKPKIILLLILLVFCAAIGGAYYFYGDKLIKQYFGGPGKSVEKKKERAVGPILPLEPFLFNIAGSSSKLAKISVGIELKNPKTIEEAKKMVPMLRDRILSILASKGIEVLVDVKSRETIKEELHNALKGLFKSQDDINAIYITDIIIQ
jgi:flagellar basal body-associated protein FliL